MYGSTVLSIGQHHRHNISGVVLFFRVHRPFQSGLVPHSVSVGTIQGLNRTPSDITERPLTLTSTKGRKTFANYSSLSVRPCAEYMSISEEMG